ncbi:hypothetical protein [Nocardia anaemiae]|uniref:hypothetical protein n=1 Tax=Nocardia anaemiae TaxID=263910 RepID=UPI0007A4626D|nr:hypothetical protein [Nocardia anaemiae]
MSEDSKQLSVAELLARNGQQGAASPGGGGRRRRSGRGISVAELTGDLPAIPVGGGGGHSAHAAPDDDEPAYEPPAYEANGYDASGYQPSGFQSSGYASGFETPAPEPTSYAAPDPAPYAAPDLPNYSPMSGPITRYDPLSAYAAPEAPADPLPAPGYSSRIMPGREMPGADSSRHAAAADPLSAPISDLYAPRPDPYAPAQDPYTPAPDPYARNPLADGASAVGSGRTGRRRRHAEPEEETTDVQPLRDLGRGIGAPPESPPNGSRSGGRAARRRAAEAAEAEANNAGPSTAPWSPSTNGFAPESAPMPMSPLPDGPSRGAYPEPPDQRRSARRDGPADGALPAWSARRNVPPKNNVPPEAESVPTAAWSLASQDQQLVSGQTVAGDLLRDEVERAEAQRANGRAAERNGRGRRGRSTPEPDEVYDGLTDVYEPFPTGDVLDDDEDFDGDDVDSDHSFASRLSPRRARSRIARKSEYDANRRQWMILGGQSTGAAVAGMLLFKGFERMWEMLPWVALCLAMIVILGLVALVRILRRTDDILSTVIAVVVGIFVTLGPLAFLLSTN